MSTPTDPTNTADDRLEALKEHIRASTRAARGQDQTGHDALLFLNTRYESFPLMVQHETTMSAAAKVVFNQLWIWAKTRQADSLSSSLFPNYDWLCRATGMSRGSVASCITQLRLIRYITLHQRVRNENKQFVGNDYILNDEPLSIADTLILDSEFIQFVEKSKAHRHRHVRALASAILSSINKHMDTADDPLRPQTHIERLEARKQAELIVQRRLFPEMIPDDAPQPESYYGIPIAEYERLTRQVNEMNAQDDEASAREQSQVHNVNAAPGETQVHNMNAAPEGTQVHNVNAAQTAPDQRVHNVNAEVNAEVNCRSSSYIYTTTTTEPEFTDAATEMPEEAEQMELIFPDFKHPTERAPCELLIRRLPPQDRQAMLDELAGRMADTTKEPLRNTVNFLRTLIKRYEQGDFVFTSYSSQRAAQRNPEQQPAPGAGQAELKRRRRELIMEIQGLDRMIELTDGDGEQATILASQRDALQQELDRLIDRKQAAGI